MPLDKNGLNFGEYYEKEKPICPYCDLKIDIADHDMFFLYEEDCHEIECPACHKTFDVVSTANWVFSTDEQEED